MLIGGNNMSGSRFSRPVLATPRHKIGRRSEWKRRVTRPVGFSRSRPGNRNSRRAKSTVAFGTSLRARKRKQWIPRITQPKPFRFHKTKGTDTCHPTYTPLEYWSSFGSSRSDQPSKPYRRRDCSTNKLRRELGVAFGTGTGKHRVKPVRQSNKAPVVRVPIGKSSSETHHPNIDEHSKIKKLAASISGAPDEPVKSADELARECGFDLLAFARGDQ